MIQIIVKFFLIQTFPVLYLPVSCLLGPYQWRFRIYVSVLPFYHKRQLKREFSHSHKTIDIPSFVPLFCNSFLEIHVPCVGEGKVY